MIDLSTYIVRACNEHDELAENDANPTRREELSWFIQRAEAAQHSDNPWSEIAWEQTAMRLGLDTV